jgi:hypothetical protein
VKQVVEGVEITLITSSEPAEYHRELGVDHRGKVSRGANVLISESRE